MVECKAHAGASLPFSAISQFDKLISFDNLEDVYPGVLLWLYEKDIVLWVKASDLRKMRDEGKKSVGIKALSDPAYSIIELPAVKKRTFMEVDYSALLDKLKEAQNG